MRKSKVLARQNYNFENGGNNFVLGYDLYSYDGSQAYSKSGSTNDVGVRNHISLVYFYSINNDCGLKKCFFTF